MKKKIIIILIILIIIGIIGTAGYFLYQKYKPQDPFELEWVQTYYNYLKKNNDTLKRKQNSLKYYRENEKIQFCKIQNIENPVMLYSYEELGQVFVEILYINENKVSTLKGFNKMATVEYLYDIEEKKCDYYIFEESNAEEKYTRIIEGIDLNKRKESQENEQTNVDDEISSYSFKIGDMISVTKLNGEVIEISRFDNKFIKTDVVEDNWYNINLNMYEEEAKKKFAKAVRNMKKELNREEKNEISKKEAEINVKKEAMIKAVEEIKRQQEEEEKRRREEEERRLAEEEARRAEEEAKKAAEEKARKKAEEEAKKAAEQARNQQQVKARKLCTKIWNI